MTAPPEPDSSLPPSTIEGHVQPILAQENYAIITHDLVRIFDQKVAVNHLNLGVRSGEFFGFLGPNGAGKSTTIFLSTDYGSSVIVVALFSPLLELLALA